ncbi:hypothetical protein GF385_02110 [Candidatus Dependentiae bacterium]|nr:hypothetical protein [Candidatus Dependentiae bacterium]
MKKNFIFFIILFSFFYVYPKEILVQGSSSVKQTKFNIKAGPIIFTEKFQNINGKITQEWNINNDSVSKDEYFKRMSIAAKEEVALKQEEERIKREEEEEAKKLALLKKEEKEKKFSKSLKLQTLKRLISLEIDNIEKEFKKLDKYKLEEYFVYEIDTFTSSQHLEDIRVTLLNRARTIFIKDEEELKEKELKDILSKLELLPKKIKNFFRSSIKFAIKNCSDTKKLKQFLSLI